MSCEASDTCEVVCADAACNVGCTDSPDCDLQGGSDEVTVDCSGSESCQVECSQSSACTVDCKDVGNCTVTLPGTNGTVQNCTQGAACTVTCGMTGIARQDGKHVVCESSPRGRMGPGSVALAHVVTESCIRCKYTDCVATCPVDCFREGENMLVIDPDECIDCQACVPACPAQAIYADGDVPADQAAFVDINARLAKQWPSIRAQKSPPPDADAWKNTPGKRKFLP